jgi:mRNA-degrading endonuclease RelE of RelBE toxin-antitoxin system
VYLQSSVEHDLKKLERKAKVRYNAIREALDFLTQDTGDSIFLEDPAFYGLRRMKADKDRIIFQVCSECDQIPENGIKVFDIEIRRTAYITW